MDKYSLKLSKHITKPDNSIITYNLYEHQLMLSNNRIVSTKYDIEIIDDIYTKDRINSITANLEQAILIFLTFVVNETPPETFKSIMNDFFKILY